MAQSKSDKPLALITSGSCLLVIIITYILLGHFSHQVAGNFRNGVYLAGVIILFLAFIGCSIWAYNAADDGGVNDNKSRIFVVAITALMFIWICGWVAGSNEKVAPGSPQMEDVKRQTSMRSGEFENSISFCKDIKGVSTRCIVQRFGATLIIDKKNLYIGDNEKLIVYLLNHWDDRDPDLIKTFSFRLVKTPSAGYVITDFKLVGQQI
jgi:cbb3-type cytochrome oxidase subunit 3